MPVDLIDTTLLRRASAPPTSTSSERRRRASTRVGHVTGRTQYFEDLRLADLLHLKMHRSERHHALLKSVDVSGALAVPGFVRVLTHEDVPNNWYTILGLIGVEPDDEPVLAGGPRPLQGRADLRRRRRDRGRRARGRGAGARRATRSCPRCSTSRRRSSRARRSSSPRATTPSCTRAIRAGAFASATSSRPSPRPTTSSRALPIVSRSSTPRRDDRLHRRPEAERASTRSTPTPRRCFFSLDNTALILGTPGNKLQLVGGTVGGGFGGKVDVIVEPIATLAAMKTNRPVKYVYSRVEEMQVSSTRARRAHLHQGRRHERRPHRRPQGHRLHGRGRLHAATPRTP